MFNCDKCGCCCENLHKSNLYKDLNRGDGVCIHFNCLTRLCEIYEKRPLQCRVDDFYDYYVSSVISKKDYYKINYEVCNQLKGGK